MGIAEIRGENIGDGVEVPDHLNQTTHTRLTALFPELPG